MTKTQLKRLLKLADYVEKKVSDEQFDMEWFRKSDEGAWMEFKGLNDCGTVGCLLGHAPFIFKPIKSDSLNCYNALDWGKFSKRVFGFDSTYEKDLWNHLFIGREGHQTRLEVVANVRKFVAERMGSNVI